MDSNRPSCVPKSDGSAEYYYLFSFPPEFSFAAEGRRRHGSRSFISLERSKLNRDLESEAVVSFIPTAPLERQRLSAPMSKRPHW